MKKALLSKICLTLLIALACDIQAIAQTVRHERVRVSTTRRTVHFEAPKRWVIQRGDFDGEPLPASSSAGGVSLDLGTANGTSGWRTPRDLERRGLVTEEFERPALARRTAVVLRGE